MAVYKDREAFIPYRRTDLIELCVEDGQLAPEDVQKFRDFCEILSAYYHFEMHLLLEILKDNYAFFNPDTETKFRVDHTQKQQKEMKSKLIHTFNSLLEKANYIPLTDEMLKLALQEKSLIELKTSVDFEDFDRVVCYYRGDSEKTDLIKKLFKKVEQKVEIYERVALLIKFKEKGYFLSKKAKLEQLSFTPGKIYLYLYKNIPKFDLEFLFPNIKISMTWKDRLLFGVPAIGAGLPLLLKVAPQLLLIAGAILFLIYGPSGIEKIKLNRQEIQNIMPVLVAALSLTVTFGGFAFRQYTNYKNKKIKFQKDVTDTLFFRNLANNASVFNALVDAAEEEECKEIILVYYHLLTSNSPLNAEQLDNQIETWMEEKFGTKIDFDINGPLRNLQAISGEINKDPGDSESGVETPLLTYDDRGFCQVLPLDDAKIVIDYIWDNAFVYTNANEAAIAE